MAPRQSSAPSRRAFLKSSAAWAAPADTLVVAVGTTMNSLDLHRVGTNRPSYQATINMYDRLLRFGTKVGADGGMVAGLVKASLGM